MKSIAPREVGMNQTLSPWSPGSLVCLGLAIPGAGVEEGVWSQQSHGDLTLF